MSAPDDPRNIMPTPRNIILAGFMGTGKTTIGRALADRLGWRFVDTDDLIEARAGKAISAIFAEDGEPAFREMEAETARALAADVGRVVATGGGMVVPEANLRALEAAGAVVLLAAEPQTIYDRVAHETHRPLLAGPDPLGEIHRLLDARREAYGRIALRVDTDARPPETVVREILRRTGLEALEGMRPADPLRVELGERAYPIHIGHDWLPALGAVLAEAFPPRPVAVVSEPTIAEHWARPVLSSLEAAGFTTGLVTIPGGETHKTIDAVSLIHDRLLRARHSRQSGLIALGGGIVGDIAGFAAATLLRGIAYIQLPTSLLAMVDSSVGGKTGVNHPLGKNLIGAFWQPGFVGIELRFLETLPDAELSAGLAEIIKYGVIADAELFAYLEQHIEAALGRDPEVLTHLIRRSCAIKAQIVAEDEREAGRRAILNFGHTFGHAAEALAHYEGLRHGEGVGMGMVAAARVAETHGLLEREAADRIEALVARAGLPVRLRPFVPEEYWSAMGSDKKVRDGRIRLVLPERVGHVRITDEVPRETVLRVLEQTMDRDRRPAARPVRMD